MASQQDIERIYDVFDELLRMGMGEFFDFTCAFYNGDYSLTLEQAQQAKHDYILRGINFKKGMRVLDIGCGWGPILKRIEDSDGEAVGITLSSRQVEVDRSHGLKVYLKDWKDMAPDEFGRFGAIVSVGAFEHFCSPQEYLESKQDEIYKSFFQFCYDTLPKGGRIYLQTSVWGKNVPAYEKVSLRAPKDSTEYLLALLENFFPGSYLPFGKEQIIRNAQGFKVVSVNTSSTDYIQTMKEWTRRFRRMNLAKLWGIAKLIPRYITDRNFRYQIECHLRSSFGTLYKRKVMHLERIFFEKV